MKCQGINSSGEPCGLPAGWGTENENYCKYHEDQGGILTFKIDTTNLSDANPYLVYDTSSKFGVVLSFDTLTYDELLSLQDELTEYESGEVSGTEIAIPSI